MGNHKALRITGFVLLPLLTLFIGVQLGAASEQLKNEQKKNVDISILWNVWNQLDAHYLHPEKIQNNEMVWGAARGMVASIGDPYTLFMSPKENTEFEDIMTGHLQGIGAELSLKNSEVGVVNVIKGSPAEKAGLLPQDIIIKVDDKTLDGLTLQEIVKLIRGKKGTSVTLTLIHGHDLAPRILTIIRDDIKIPSTEYEVKSGKNGSVGVLTISQFGVDTIKEVQAIIANEVQEKNIKGLVIDLRYNGGGYLEGAVSLCSMFMKEGKVVTVQGREGAGAPHYVTGNPVLPLLPLVVLINQGTASASEIVAGALQDDNRAKIIGMKSFGKGSVQQVLDLPGGSSLRVTIARWLTSSGRDLGKEGVTPDIVVDRSLEDALAERDPQMDSALAWLLEGKVVSTPAAKK